MRSQTLPVAPIIAGGAAEIQDLRNLNRIDLGQRLLWLKPQSSSACIHVLQGPIGHADNPHIEKHFTGSETVRDVVIGMADGLTVPFALAAGLSTAVSSTKIIATAGLAESSGRHTANARRTLLRGCGTGGPS
jgi:VIT family